MDELTEQSRQRIGRLLKSYRTKAGLSLAELATLAQYSKSAIHKIEQGRGDLMLDMAKAVDRVMNTGGRFVAALSEPKFFRPAQLPVINSQIAGMDAEFRRLEGWLYQSERDEDRTARRVMVVTGPPWIGTSTLMLRAAHSVTAVGLFPDGQLYADLAGFREDQLPRAPDEVLASFLRALGAWVPPEASCGELTQQYRTALAGREMLIVLDNAASAEQIAPLLPGPSATGCRVLVASRLSLAYLTTSVADRIEAGPLPQSRLDGLLTRLLGSGHPITRQTGAVARLAAGAAGFPSVITMTAGWLADNPDFPIMSGAAYEEALFSPSDVSPLRAALDASYRHVSPGAQRLLRLITVWPNKAISVAAAAQLLGASDTEASTCLAELSAANLVRADRDRGRYRHLALLCRYGRFLSTMHDTTADRVAARDRLLSWYLQAAVATERAVAADGASLVTCQQPEPVTPASGFPTSTAALDWIRAEGENLVGVVQLAVAAGQHRLAWQFALACRAGLDAAAAASPTRWGALWRDVFEAARLAARVDDDRGYALTSCAVAQAYARQGEWDLAAAALEEVSDAWRRLQAGNGITRTLLHRGVAWARVARAAVLAAGGRQHHEVGAAVHDALRACAEGRDRDGVVLCHIMIAALVATQVPANPDVLAGTVHHLDTARAVLKSSILAAGTDRVAREVSDLLAEVHQAVATSATDHASDASRPDRISTERSWDAYVATSMFALLWVLSPVGQAHAGDRQAATPADRPAIALAHREGSETPRSSPGMQPGCSLLRTGRFRARWHPLPSSSDWAPCR